MNVWPIITFIAKLTESLSAIMKNIREFFSGVPTGPSNNKKINPVVLCGIFFFVFVMSVVYWAYASQSKPTMDDNYPPVSIVDEPNENNEIIPQSTSSNTLVSDVDCFYNKYYDDTITSLYDLPILDSSLSDRIADFVMLDSIEFKKNNSLEDAQPEVHKLLEKASNLEQNAKNDSIHQEIANLRAEAYELCNNYTVARLLGNDYNKLFLSATGDQQRLDYGRASIQYFVRSILLSKENHQNISYCAMLIGNILTNLASLDPNSHHRAILYQKALFYMHMAKHYHTKELFFSYYAVCNSLANTYYNLFDLYKNSVNDDFLNYLYNEGCGLYKIALSDISRISAADEDQYQKNSDLFHTVYKQYQKTN